MRLPASPEFIKFFETVSKEEQNLFLEKMYAFFSNIEGRTSSIEIHSLGERYHRSLKRIKLHDFLFERYNHLEHWHVGFYDTAIPHARIEMWNCSPPLKNDYSLALDYTQLLIENCLADTADGFDDTPKPFFQKILRLLPQNWFATVGTITWIYLIFKIRAIPELDKQFCSEITLKLPFYSFGKYLCAKREYEQQDIVKVSMNKQHFKSFIESNDTWILNTFSLEEIVEWLNRLNIEFETWFNATEMLRERGNS